MYEFSLIQKIAVWALPVLFAITVHEVAHGWVARYLGDPTAMMLGRLTLNPVKHIDPVGTIAVPLLMLLFTPFVFGWARPVPVTWENLRHPKRDMALVAVAGPAANLLMASIWALVLKLGMVLAPDMMAVGMFLIGAAVAGIFINAVLMILNLLPLPPLDGGRVLTGLLPGWLSWQVSRLEPYGLLLLVTLLVTGVLGSLVLPPLQFILGTFTGSAGMNPQFLDIMLHALGLVR